MIDVYIGVDLGTTACKAVLYDIKGQKRAEYGREYPLIKENGHFEQDANLWWSIVREAIASLAEGYGDAVQALSVSAQGISFVPVDLKGNPLYNAISWLDMRGEKEIALLNKHFSDESIYHKTGKHLNPCYSLPKMMWFKKHHPDLYENTYRFLMPLDFLNLKLCGKPVTDYTMAGGTMLYNIQDKVWDKELLDFSEIDPGKLPDVRCMGAELGRVLPKAATELNISNKTRIILGGQDQKLAAIGAGIRKGICTVSLGTSAAITETSGGFDACSCKPQFRLNDTDFVKESAVPVCGAALRWLSQLFGDMPYAEMDKLAEEASDSAGDVVFNPAFLDKACIGGLGLSTTRGEIIRALYEGIAREIKIYVGDTISKVKVFGGGAKSRVWCKIISQVLQKDLEILDTVETACRGAAILASGFSITPTGTMLTIPGKGE